MTDRSIRVRGSRPVARKFGPEPRYPLEPLMQATGASWQEIAARVGRCKTHGYNRLRHGVTWTEADEWAVAYGLLPFEVWPEWLDADPATWCDLGPEAPAEVGVGRVAA